LQGVAAHATGADQRLAREHVVGQAPGGNQAEPVTLGGQRAHRAGPRTRKPDHRHQEGVEHRLRRAAHAGCGRRRAICTAIDDCRHARRRALASARRRSSWPGRFVERCTFDRPAARNLHSTSCAPRLHRGVRHDITRRSPKRIMEPLPRNAYGGGRRDRLTSARYGSIGPIATPVGNRWSFPASDRNSRSPPAQMPPEPIHDPAEAPLPDVRTEVRNTTCYMCACRCGIRVHLRDGEVRYIEGNPDHPLNQGVICAKGSSGIMKQYSPARLTKPLRRKAGAERGSGRFEAISWDEAFALLEERLAKIRSTDPKKFALFTGRDQMQALTGLFARQFGTPNYAAHGGFCSVNMAAGMIY